MATASADQSAFPQNQEQYLELESSEPDKELEDHQNENLTSTLPSLEYDLREHKTHLAIFWTLVILTSAIWPLVLYFALKYGTDEDLSTIFGICLAIPGVVSLYSDGKRTWRLWKKDSTYLPIGQTNRWAFDFFHWNFIVAATVVTVMICVGSSIPSYPVSSLTLAALLLQVSLELLVAEVAVTFKWRAPFRISSTAKGELTRPGVYVLVEDVIAVDGGAGTAFRERWLGRYRASPELRAHLRLMDLLWGVSGVIVVVVIFVIVLIDITPVAGYAVGWALPWVWAACMTLVTIILTKRMLERERRTQKRGLKTSRI